MKTYRIEVYGFLKNMDNTFVHLFQVNNLTLEQAFSKIMELNETEVTYRLEIESDE